MIIRVPVHTAAGRICATGALAPVEVAVHESDEGSYLPPVFSICELWQNCVIEKQRCPPQTIISVPVHTAEWNHRFTGTFAPVEVAVQLSVAGS
jgi:hypothetical protein